MKQEVIKTMIGDVSLAAPKTISQTVFVHTGLLIAALGFGPQQAWAQVQPDSGQILRENLERDLQPLQPSVDFRPQGQPLTEAPEGGARVQVAEIQFSGNTVYSSEQLMEAIGGVLGRSFDLAGLRNITNDISTFYRNNGYIFARAVLPPQDLADGVLMISVVEGQYGSVQAVGDESLTKSAQHFLNTLKPGAVIRSRPLERHILVLGDQPGVDVSPVIRPGSVPGTGDLDVWVVPGRRFEADLGADNHGGKFSGQYRGHASMRINGLVLFGDQVSLRASYSSEGLKTGQVGYAIPLGGQGLRANVTYARTSYDLARPFEDFSGTATITSAGLSYPLVRTSTGNLISSITYNYRDADSKVQGTRFEFKTSDSLPISLQFDRRDGLGGGGVTYGSFSVTPGDQRSDNAGAVQGGYLKSNLQLVRIQNLDRGLSLFTRLSWQWADSTLDSYEGFTLGGAADVRAYPQGEASGDKGVLAQIELRYRSMYADPYVFFDAGQIKRDSQGDRRNLTGGGVGLRYNRQQVRVDVAVAWKTGGGDAVTVANQRNPQLWFSSSYLF